MACNKGELGCECTAANECNDLDYKCVTDAGGSLCVFDTSETPPCFPGNAGCQCDNGQCNADNECEPVGTRQLCLPKIEKTPSSAAALQMTFAAMFCALF